MHWYVRGLSCKPNIYVSWSTSELKVRLVHRLTGLSPPVKHSTDLSKAVLLLWILYDFSVLCLLCIYMRLFICALWSPAGKGLTFWLSFVVSSCKFVTFPLVSWVRCGTWLYRFLIFAPLLASKWLFWIYKLNHHKLLAQFMPCCSIVFKSTLY